MFRLYSSYIQTSSAEETPIAGAAANHGAGKKTTEP